MKRFDYRIVLGAVLLVGGGLLLLQTMGYLRDAGDWFWGVAFLIAGGAFLSMLLSGHWWSAFPGMTLLALGVTILLPESLDEFGGLTFLGGIGIAFWIVYFMDRSSWWALIPAGVLSTLAIVSALPDSLEGIETGGVFFLGLALTFLLVALLAGMRWAFWPAAALGVLGFLTTISAMSIANYVWAVALIGGGGYLIYNYITNK
jgi:hypothetical protein